MVELLRDSSGFSQIPEVIQNPLATASRQSEAGFKGHKTYYQSVCGAHKPKTILRAADSLTGTYARPRPIIGRSAH